MRIGDLSDRTGVSRRMLRYYEEQGLIASQRCANGYRDYGEPCVDRVQQVRGLLDAGLPTQTIRKILPCLGPPGRIDIPDPTPETIALLEDECARMSQRIGQLTRNRDAMAAYLTEVRRAVRPGPAAAGTAG
ncbi:MerR family transcriptional regulator [Streptomyces subrutilus]|uniref:MerR family transcriptional regulator n=1 Tax=Streptomyces subrutilus TaxID=36818 RepID=A0A5P2UK74_9ACTN|nr:MerR family transcriptional regulator [Streptomyces subrutilus]QEU77904.1 MerR family transcriptional regulator [Streptomyces subrutilus]WSJ32947.1 MerR family transcriptional regulator [Streptomyces subrutilus]GGZ63216.1 MerR family transcriptional regulator [Streptomyces subrutilus]